MQTINMQMIKNAFDGFINKTQNSKYLFFFFNQMQAACVVFINWWVEIHIL